MKHTGQATASITVVVEELVKRGDEFVDIEVKKHREKRTLNANAYFWTMADKLAKVLSIRGTRPLKSLDIYKEYIKDIGAFVYIPVKESEIERFTEIWTAKGEGWLCEVTGDCKRTPGYCNVKCYYGSSVYNSEQMGRLIDLLIADCKDNEIETRTPDELAELKSLWGEK